jgi:hypothetical protein
MGGFILRITVPRVLAARWRFLPAAAPAPAPAGVPRLVIE